MPGFQSNAAVQWARSHSQQLFPPSGIDAGREARESNSEPSGAINADATARSAAATMRRVASRCHCHQEPWGSAKLIHVWHADGPRRGGGGTGSGGRPGAPGHGRGDDPGSEFEAEGRQSPDPRWLGRVTAMQRRNGRVLGGCLRSQLGRSGAKGRAVSRLCVALPLARRPAISGPDRSLPRQ